MARGGGSENSIDMAAMPAFDAPAWLPAAAVKAIKRVDPMSPEWGALAAHPHFAHLANTPQEPRWHGEGDVLVHTKMVHAAALSDPEFATLPANEQAVLAWAAIWHDVGKARTTCLEDGKIRAPHHARIGSHIARGAGFQLGWTSSLREAVCCLSANHMRPPHLAKDLNLVKAARIAEELAQAGLTWRHLLLLARADQNGRIGEDLDQQLENLELLGMWLEEQALLDGPQVWASADARLRSLKGQWQPHVMQPPAARHLIVMVGLPASGKSTWAKANAKQLGADLVDQDSLRDRTPGKNRSQREGRLRQAVQESIKASLRADRNVIVDATHLTRLTRQRYLRLAQDYNAQMLLVCIERPCDELLAANSARTGYARVPDSAIAQMVDRWEYPQPSEAHEIRIVQSSG